MLAFALAVGIGFAIVVLIVGSGARPDTGGSRAARPGPAREEQTAPGRPIPAPSPGEVAGQDAQDRARTRAYRQAVREVGGHRALQHVPWHRGGVSIELIGADGDRAVLAVEGPNLAMARRGWHLFLRRFHDDGRSYVPRISVAKGGRW
jgi:hypothetical protein